MKAKRREGKRRGKLLQRRLTSTVPPAMIPARLRRSPLALWMDGSTGRRKRYGTGSELMETSKPGAFLRFRAPAPA